MPLAGETVSFDARTRGFFGEAKIYQAWSIGAEYITGDATKKVAFGTIDLRHVHADATVRYRFSPTIQIMVGARSYNHYSKLDGVRLQEYKVIKGLYGLTIQTPMLAEGLKGYSTLQVNDVQMDFKTGLNYTFKGGAFLDVAYKSNRFQDSFKQVALVRTNGVEGSVGFTF